MEAGAASSDSEEPHFLAVPGAEQVWNACGFFTRGGDCFEEPFDGDMAWHMITVLEQRELSESDLCVELLHLTPVASRMVFHEPPPPPCSTLADCLLRRAATLSRADTIAHMLTHGARLDFDATVLEHDTCLGTPLVNACEVGNTDIVRMLLDSGADINAWTRCCEFLAVDCGFAVRMDWTAVHAACAWGRLEAVQLLVERRADTSALCRYQFFQWPTGEPDEPEDGPSAFHLACARGHLDVVAFLHSSVGASLESVGRMYGFSLVGAAEHVVVLDWSHNSSIAMDSDCHEYYSPPLAAPLPDCGYITCPASYYTGCMNQHTCATQFPWVSINAGRIVVGSPLLLACVRGCSDVIKYLLDAGADADARGHHMIAPEDKAGCTPLDILNAFGHAEAVELLLSATAGSERKGARTTPIKTRAQLAGVQLEETPPAVRRDIAEGGPVTRAKAKAEMRAIQKARVQRVTRAEQAGTVRAALFRANDTQRKAAKRASEPSKVTGTRRAYMCKKCGEPKKGHVCMIR